MENAANIESTVDGLEADFESLRRSATSIDTYIEQLLIDYDDETEEYLNNLNEDSRTQLLEDYADMERDFGSRLFHISASLARLDTLSTQMPVGLGGVQRCLSDVECFGMLEQVREYYEQGSPWSFEQMDWHNLVASDWDAHALPEINRESFFLLRQSQGGVVDYCYRSLECSIPLGKAIASQIELAHTIHTLNHSPDRDYEQLQNLAREICREHIRNEQVLWDLEGFYIIPDWQDAYVDEFINDRENACVPN